MALQDEVNQTVQDAELKVKIAAIVERSDMLALSVARYWRQLEACGVPESERRELTLQAAEMLWSQALGLVCHGHEGGD